VTVLLRPCAVAANSALREKKDNRPRKRKKERDCHCMKVAQVSHSTKQANSGTYKTVGEIEICIATDFSHLLCLVILLR